MVTRAILLLVAVCGTSAEYLLAEYAPNHDDYKPSKYHFSYGVSDPSTGDHKHHWETRDGDHVRGEYGLLQPDGVTRIVEYTSDPHHGFRATVHKIGEPQLTKGTALYGIDHPGLYSSQRQPAHVHHEPVQLEREPEIAHVDRVSASEPSVQYTHDPQSYFQFPASNSEGVEIIEPGGQEPPRAYTHVNPIEYLLRLVQDAVPAQQDHLDITPISEQEFQELSSRFTVSKSPIVARSAKLDVQSNLFEPTPQSTERPLEPTDRLAKDPSFFALIKGFWDLLTGRNKSAAGSKVGEAIYNAGDGSTPREPEQLVRQLNATCLYLQFNETNQYDEEDRDNIYNAGDYSALRERENLVRSVNVTCENLFDDAIRNMTAGLDIYLYCGHCFESDRTPPRGYQEQEDTFLYRQPDHPGSP